MDEENEIRDDVEETRGIEENETDHRINEFRDIVRRLDEVMQRVDGVSRQLAEHNDAVMGRLDSMAGIASDNGADEGAGSYRDESDDEEDDITARDWSELADELNI